MSFCFATLLLSQRLLHSLRFRFGHNGGFVRLRVCPPAQRSRANIHTLLPRPAFAKCSRTMLICFGGCSCGYLGSVSLLAQQPRLSYVAIVRTPLCLPELNAPPSRASHTYALAVLSLQGLAKFRFARVYTSMFVA